MMNATNIKVSIVTVCYNCEAVIEKTIKSIVDQSYASKEYIVVDGNSSDHTLSIIEKYSSKIDKIKSEPDKGIYDAMNKAIMMAEGEWIIFMNAGDIFYDDKSLEKVFERDHDDVDVVCCQNYYVRKKGMVLNKVDKPFFKYSRGTFCSMGFSHQAVFIRTNLAVKYKFDMIYKCCADFNMFVRLRNDGGRFRVLSFPVSIVEDGDGFSIQNRRTQFEDQVAITESADSMSLKMYLFQKRIKNVIKKIIGK